MGFYFSILLTNLSLKTNISRSADSEKRNNTDAGSSYHSGHRTPDCGEKFEFQHCHFWPSDSDLSSPSSQK